MKEKTLAITAPKLQLQTQNRKASLWTREKTNQLIELYKKHECLWNHWHEAYKSKDKRNRAIAEICSKLNIPKFEFGKKVHNLRNQFNTEMKKLEQRIEEAGVNIDDANDTELRCKWSHFESLMFLRHVIEPRPGCYQNSFQSSKKMHLKFDLNNSEDDINVTTVPTNRSSNCGNTEDSSQIQYEDNVNDEVITDDFQNLENEVEEVDHSNCNEEICDQKYQPLQQKQGFSISTRTSIKPPSNKTLHVSQTSSPSRTNISSNEESTVMEVNSSNITVVSPQSHTPSASTPSALLTTPLYSSFTSSNSSNRAVSYRDQWDAFGELVANELRNLNSEISRKRLKRKIMHSILEIGEEDDNLVNSHSRCD